VRSQPSDVSSYIVPRLLNRVLAIPDLDSESLHSWLADSRSDYCLLLGSMAAAQRYQGRLCDIKVHAIADHCESGLY